MAIGTPWWTGLGLALAVTILARVVGFDRDRAFYPTLLLVIASCYGLFAVMSGSMSALVTETVAMTGFLLVAVLGFRANLWFLVAGLLAHGIFDYVHAYLIPNPGVPAWWSGFCLSYDVMAAACLAVLLGCSRIPARPRALP
ncbi:MAG: hypothetical protein R3F24_14765 [Gammaproteobacteria bacterium]